MKDSLRPALFSIVLIALLATTPRGAEAFYICANPEIQVIFAPKFGSYHCYGTPGCEDPGVVTTLCHTSMLGCTVDNVFVIMLQSVSYVAPTNEIAPVHNCKDTDLPAGFIPSAVLPQPITTTVNGDQRSISNWTRPGHIFHPGKITRTISLEGGYVRVRTKGVGNGPFPDFNVWWATNEAFPQVDGELWTAVNDWLSGNGAGATGGGGGGGGGGGIFIPPGFSCQDEGGVIICTHPE